MILRFASILVIINMLPFCSGEPSGSERLPGYKAPSNPQFGSSTFTASSTGTSTSSSARTSTGTSTSTGLVDNTPPAPLSIGGQQLTADRPWDCPNSACVLSVATNVASASATVTATTTQTGNLLPGTIPIRNYFKNVCAYTQVADLFRPIFWESCIGSNSEEFLAEIQGGSQEFILHPGTREDLCMDIGSVTATAGIQVALLSCNGTPSQVWVLDNSNGSFDLIHPKSDVSLCLVRGQNGSSGDSTLGLWPCSNTNTMLMWEGF